MNLQRNWKRIAIGTAAGLALTVGVVSAATVAPTIVSAQNAQSASDLSEIRWFGQRDGFGTMGRGGGGQMMLHQEEALAEVLHGELEGEDGLQRTYRLIAFHDICLFPDLWPGTGVGMVWQEMKARYGGEEIIDPGGVSTPQLQPGQRWRWGIGVIEAHRVLTEAPG